MVLLEIYIAEELNVKNFFIKGKMKYEDKMRNNFDIQFFTIKQVFHKNLACLTSSIPTGTQRCLNIQITLAEH